MLTKRALMMLLLEQGATIRTKAMNRLMNSLMCCTASQNTDEGGIDRPSIFEPSTTPEDQPALADHYNDANLTAEERMKTEGHVDPDTNEEKQSSEKLLEKTTIPAPTQKNAPEQEKSMMEFKLHDRVEFVQAIDGHHGVKGKIHDIISKADVARYGHAGILDVIYQIDGVVRWTQCDPTDVVKDRSERDSTDSLEVVLKERKKGRKKEKSKKNRKKVEKGKFKQDDSTDSDTVLPKKKNGKKSAPEQEKSLMVCFNSNSSAEEKRSKRFAEEKSKKKCREKTKKKKKDVKPCKKSTSSSEDSPDPDYSSSKTSSIVSKSTKKKKVYLSSDSDSSKKKKKKKKKKVDKSSDNDSWKKKKKKKKKVDPSSDNETHVMDESSDNESSDPSESNCRGCTSKMQDSDDSGQEQEDSDEDSNESVGGFKKGDIVYIKELFQNERRPCKQISQTTGAVKSKKDFPKKNRVVMKKSRLYVLENLSLESSVEQLLLEFNKQLYPYRYTFVIEIGKVESKETRDARKETNKNKSSKLKSSKNKTTKAKKSKDSDDSDSDSDSRDDSDSDSDSRDDSDSDSRDDNDSDSESSGSEYKSNKKKTTNAKKRYSKH